MRLQLQYKPYQRRFRHPIRMGSNMQIHRKGIIVRLQSSDGSSGFGEVAPIESFGSESFEKAIRTLKSYHGVIHSEALLQFTKELPCLRYALKNAFNEIVQATVESKETSVDVVESAQLLSPAALLEMLGSGSVLPLSKVVKMKVVDPNLEMNEEIRMVIRAAEICQQHDLRLRLDANEQLSFSAALKWIGMLENYRDVIEFFEQPLPRIYIQEMLELAAKSMIPLAFDESIPLLEQQGLTENDMLGFFCILKPSLGDFACLDRIRIPMTRVVISSAFESAIGFSQLLDLAPFNCIPGLGTQSFFDDDLSYPHSGISTRFCSNQIRSETIWTRIK